jgi:hypothetical protein
MPVRWSAEWKSGDNHDVAPTMSKEGLLSIITSMPDHILRVQPAAVRDAVALVKADSENVMIMKGLHQIGKEHIDIKKVGRVGGPTVHLYCMNYTLVESGLRAPYDDLSRLGTGWRITGSTCSETEGDANQGMDKTGEINHSSYRAKKASQEAFADRHY